MSIAAGQTTATFKITGVAEGPASITATSPGYISGKFNILVVKLGSISLPNNLSVAPGQSASLDVKLSVPAPTDGVTVALVERQHCSVDRSGDRLYTAGRHDGGYSGAGHRREVRIGGGDRVLARIHGRYADGEGSRITQFLDSGRYGGRRRST